MPEKRRGGKDVEARGKLQFITDCLVSLCGGSLLAAWFFSSAFDVFFFLLSLFLLGLLRRPSLFLFFGIFLDGQRSCYFAWVALPPAAFGRCNVMRALRHLTSGNDAKKKKNVERTAGEVRGGRRKGFFSLRRFRYAGCLEHGASAFKRLCCGSAD